MINDLNQSISTKLNTFECGDILPNDHQTMTFYDIINMKHKMAHLAGYVQNDFEQMLNDGTVTKEGIMDAVEDMKQSFNSVIGDLNILRDRCKIIMEYHCLPNNNEVIQ